MPRGQQIAARRSQKAGQAAAVPEIVSLPLPPSTTSSPPLKVIVSVPSSARSGRRSPCRRESRARVRPLGKSACVLPSAANPAAAPPSKSEGRMRRAARLSRHTAPRHRGRFNRQERRRPDRSGRPFRQRGLAAGLQHEISSHEIDRPDQPDREICYAVAVGVAFDERIAVVLHVVQLPGDVGNAPAPRKANFLVAGEGGVGVDQVDLDAVGLGVAEVGDDVGRAARARRRSRLRRSRTGRARRRR